MCFDDLPGYLYHFPLVDSLPFGGRLSKNGVLYIKSNVRKFSGQQAWKDPLDFTAIGNSWCSGLPVHVYTDSKWHRWLWICGGWMWGEKSSRDRDFSLYQKRIKWSLLQEQIPGVPWNHTLGGTQSTAYRVTSASEGQEKGILQELWSHQVMLQGQTRPWNFSSFTSCLLARAAS